jgi:deazaflavin-dependent oxidoreductase (nitroreductase family)
MSPIEIPGGHLMRDAVRRYNKYVLNPLMLRLAGRRHWYASALHHVGRRSGRAYVTPVVADAVAGGYLVPLPYGSDVDWLRNVLAAGTCTLDVHGRTVALHAPQVLPAERVLPLLPSSRAAWWRLTRMREFLVLSIEPLGTPAGI